VIGGNVAAVPEQGSVPEQVSDLQKVATQINQVAIQLHDLNKRMNSVLALLQQISANIAARPT
jgi:hypothetical protein